MELTTLLAWELPGGRARVGVTMIHERAAISEALPAHVTRHRLVAVRGHVTF